MSLLFIEDRGLLDASRPNANPAVDWPRFTKAAISQLEKRSGLGGQAAGAAPWPLRWKSIVTPRGAHR